MLLERAHTAFVTQTAGIGGLPVTADDGNFPVPHFNQGIHGSLRRQHIVGGDAGQVPDGKSCGVVGDHHPRHRNGGISLPEVGVAAAQKQDAQRLLGGQQRQCPLHLVVVFVHVVDGQLIGGSGHKALDFLHHLGKQLVAPAFYDS